MFPNVILKINSKFLKKIEWHNKKPLLGHLPIRMAHCIICSTELRRKTIMPTFCSIFRRKNYKYFKEATTVLGSNQLS